MVQLTVGYVAGFIAAGMFIGKLISHTFVRFLFSGKVENLLLTLARLWAPSIITFILSGLLGDTNSAATW